MDPRQRLIYTRRPFWRRHRWIIALVLAAAAAWMLVLRAVPSDEQAAADTAESIADAQLDARKDLGILVAERVAKAYKQGLADGTKACGSAP